MPAALPVAPSAMASFTKCFGFLGFYTETRALRARLRQGRKGSREAPLESAVSTVSSRQQTLHTLTGKKTRDRLRLLLQTSASLSGSRAVASPPHRHQRSRSILVLRSGPQTPRHGKNHDRKAQSQSGQSESGPEMDGRRVDESQARAEDGTSATLRYKPSPDPQRPLRPLLQVCL